MGLLYSVTFFLEMKSSAQVMIPGFQIICDLVGLVLIPLPCRVVFQCLSVQIWGDVRLSIKLCRRCDVFGKPE
jgi:hypothetical protein